MIKKLYGFLPFNIRKHYIQPLILLLRNRNSYCNLYNAANFFDKFHSLSDVQDDRATISPDFPATYAKFHYNALENEIISYIKKHRLDTKVILDIGSGAGHWIDFYYSVFNSSNIYGVDISEVAVSRLIDRFKDNDSVNIIQSDVGFLSEADKWGKDTFNLINAIGVMFHIVSDKEWDETIQWCYDKLLPGGLMIVSGLFGIITANVQFEPDHFNTIEEYNNKGRDSILICNKRVRSKHYWKHKLKKSGFRKVTFMKTKKPGYIHTPENNLLFAIK